jgi:translocation and assembly module TamB
VRAGRLLRRALAACASTAVLAAVAAPLSLRFAPVRRTAIERINGVLAKAFVGRVVVDGVDGIGLTSIDGIDAHVETADGATLLRVSGARARLSTWPLVRSLFARSGPIEVDVPELSVADASALVDTGPDGKLRVAEAFGSRPDAAPGEGRGAKVSFANVQIVHGAVDLHLVASGPPVHVELAEARAKVSSAGGAVAVDLEHARIDAHGLLGNVHAIGEAEGRFTHPAPRLRVAWHGTLGTLAEHAQLTYDDGHIDGVVDVDGATPEQLRSVWRECPLSEPTRLHVEAHGALPRLEVAARGAVGDGAIEMAGTVVVAPNLQATLHVSTRGLDAHALAEAAPPSNVTASGDVAVTSKPDGTVEARTSLDVAPGSIAGADTPPTKVDAELSRASSGALSARADLAVSRPGTPTAISARLEQRGSSLVLSFEGQADIARIAALPGLDARASGSAVARVGGSMDVTAGTIDAHATATLSHASTRGVSVETGRLEAHATGPAARPTVEAQLEAEGVESHGVRLSAARARGQLTFVDGVVARDVDIEVAGEGEPARVHVPRVRLAGGVVDVADAVVDGLGSPLAASVKASAGSVEVQAKSDGIDLARIATFVPLPAERGTVAVDVDASVGAGAAHGRLAIELQHVRLPGIDDANARVETHVDGRHGWGRATATIDDLGTIDVRSSSVHVGAGPLLDAAPWRHAWGAVQFHAQADLARLAARLPSVKDHLAGIAGSLDVQGQVARDSADDATPAVELTVGTKGLALRSPWALDGVDPTLYATVDGESGNTTIALQIKDAAGVIATLDASSDAVPYSVVFSDTDPVAALAATPFDAKLAIPSRALDALPGGLRVQGVGGTVEGTLSWQGTMSAPTIDASLEVKGGRPWPAVLSRRSDWALGGHYDGARLNATVRASAHGRQVLDATADVKARAEDLLAALRGAPLPWTASAHAKVAKLSLQDLTTLDDRQVRGDATGEVTIEDLHADAQAKLSLDVQNLQVGDIACKSSRMNVTVDGHALDASARVEQTDGFADVKAHAGARWGAAMAPEFDPSQPSKLVVLASKFRAALLLPFVSRFMSDVDGRIDAEVHLTNAPGDTSTSATTAMGTIMLKDGSFELSSFGGEFHDVSGLMTLTPDRVVRLQNFVAHGLTGVIHAAASARLDGLSLSGARVTVNMPAKDPLPLIFDGVQMGLLDGDFDVSASRAPDRSMRVNVDVPTAHVQLPTSRSSVDVQALGDVAGVRVGRRDPAAGFIEVPLDRARDESPGAAAKARTPIEVDVQLGDVRVSRGTDLDVRIEGRPTVMMAGDTRVGGQIRIPRGTIDVEGKPFSIDAGTVSFVGPDASNPQVLLTASWDAPDGTHVYADFAGPLKTGKVKLRAEPSKTQSEILGLILFGTDDQTTPQGATPAQVSPMAAAAGGAATQPLNRALDSLGLAGGISTKIDTSQVNPRPEVEVQIARDISIQVAWVLGVQTTGAGDTTYVTLNWHFLRQWSLETTVGDAGSSVLDVVWRHRY